MRSTESTSRYNGTIWDIFYSIHFRLLSSNMNSFHFYYTYPHISAASILWPLEFGCISFCLDAILSCIFTSPIPPPPISHFRLSCIAIWCFRLPSFLPKWFITTNIIYHMVFGVCGFSSVDSSPFHF